MTFSCLSSKGGGSLPTCKLKFSVDTDRFAEFALLALVDLDSADVEFEEGGFDELAVALRGCLSVDLLADPGDPAAK